MDVYVYVYVVASYNTHSATIHSSSFFIVNFSRSHFVHYCAFMTSIYSQGADPPDPCTIWIFGSGGRSSTEAPQAPRVWSGV